MYLTILSAKDPHRGLGYFQPSISSLSLTYLPLSSYYASDTTQGFWNPEMGRTILFQDEQQACRKLTQTQSGSLKGTLVCSVTQGRGWQHWLINSALERVRASGGQDFYSQWSMTFWSRRQNAIALASSLAIYVSNLKGVVWFQKGLYLKNIVLSHCDMEGLKIPLL